LDVRLAAVVAAGYLVCACTAHQARVARRAGEVTAASALFGILATVVAAEVWSEEHEDLLEAGLVFVPITIGGAGVYVAADQQLSAAESAPVATNEHTSTWNAAMDLAKDAKHAARRGDCAEVQAIQPRVRDLDSEVYLRFVNDKVIQTCLGPQ
jgi:hypothetical protein